MKALRARVRSDVVEPSNLWSILGLVTGAADDDPRGIATYGHAGASEARRRRGSRLLEAGPLRLDPG
jgi:hypothetical protein